MKTIHDSRIVLDQSIYWNKLRFRNGHIINHTLSMRHESLPQNKIENYSESAWSPVLFLRTKYKLDMTDKANETREDESLLYCPSSLYHPW
jgi:hypothetical protein